MRGCLSSMSFFMKKANQFITSASDNMLDLFKLNLSLIFPNIFLLFLNLRLFSSF